MQPKYIIQGRKLLTIMWLGYYFMCQSVRWSTNICWCGSVATHGWCKLHTGDASYAQVMQATQEWCKLHTSDASYTRVMQATHKLADISGTRTWWLRCENLAVCSMHDRGTYNSIHLCHCPSHALEYCLPTIPPHQYSTRDTFRLSPGTASHERNTLEMIHRSRAYSRKDISFLNEI